MKWFFLLLIRLYKILLSPFLGQRCRFYPTCSSYAQEYIERHGVMRAILPITWRLLRCGPWCPGGHDEVPPIT
jgi:putative membrane protein insertion efficiency factor